MCLCCFPALPAALEQVLPLMSAIASMGKGAAGCIGKAITTLAAKKSLEAGKVARGLEAVITGRQCEFVGE